ncbi:LuxS/MPP-like metallohydrolase [Neoconidiobolus thromboides FSU 785]|nr:LuxS/MPP-like metallohydrolase [Neoconidiobolus thromboides FSU 785]
MLDNGIRVVSDDVPGHFAAFGVYVDAGSRYETKGFSGISHMLDRISFKATENLTSEQIQNQVEEMGGNLMSHSSREMIQYQGTVYHQDVEKIAYLFAEMTQKPLVLQSEIDEQKISTSYEIENLISNPETYIPELLHSVAFGGKTLGKPFLCTPRTLNTMNAARIKEYLSKMFIPERMVIAASGLDHEKVVDLANKYYSSIKAPIKQEDQARSSIQKITEKIFHPSTSFEPDNTSAVYHGGVELENNDITEFTQVYVGVNGVKITDEDLYPLATLQALLGGGSSFSAGGPGKGMHSRLYRTVLNQYGWSQSCQSFNHSYKDGGIFGISGSCPADYSLDMLHVIGYSLASVCDPKRISKVELERAKNQLKNNLLMNLESRLIRLEDMGQQVLVAGYRVSPEIVCNKIEALTQKDLARVASKLFLSSEVVPTVIGYGRNLEPLRDAQQILAKFGIGGVNSYKA